MIDVLGGKMVHFYNDILGVTASILITVSLLGEVYPITCLQGNWKSVPQQGCILVSCTGPLRKVEEVNNCSLNDEMYVTIFDSLVPCRQAAI